jgi:S1-C subfamily serine protease
MTAQRPDRTDAVVSVGKGGRGFIIEADQRRYVITAAHCLRRLPPAHSFAYTKELRYRRLLGPLSARRRTVWAECVFLDPVADIAVLSEPHSQELFNEYEAYASLTDPVTPLPLGTLTFVQRERQLPEGPVSRFGGAIRLPREAEASGWILSLDRRWVACTVKSIGGRAASVEKSDAPIEFGMSGSPILGPDGRAIAVASGGEVSNPLLADVLPGWLLRAVSLTPSPAQ